MIVAKNDSELAFALALTRGDEAAVGAYVESVAPGCGSSKDEALQIARRRRSALADLAADGRIDGCEAAELRHLNAWLARNGRPKVDVHRLVEDIKRLELEHRAWKRKFVPLLKTFQRSGTGYWSEAWKAFSQAQKEIPERDQTSALASLYSLRAWLRGRIHQRRCRQPDGTVRLMSFEETERKILGSGRLEGYYVTPA